MEGLYIALQIPSFVIEYRLDECAMATGVGSSFLALVSFLINKPDSGILSMIHSGRILAEKVDEDPVDE